jgi:outer membrane immunogenic protein
MNTSTTTSATPFTTGPAPIVGVHPADDEHTVKAGLNYRFNWGGQAAGY